MSLLDKAKEMTIANLMANESAINTIKDKRKVAFMATSNDSVNYLAPSTMKIKSFKNMVNKNVENVSNLDGINIKSVNLK